MSQGWSGGSDTRWRALRARVLRLDLPWGQRPGCRIGYEGVCAETADCVDHIIPLHMGGSKYDPSNCRPACTPCNLRRNAEKSEPAYEPPPLRVSSW